MTVDHFLTLNLFVLITNMWHMFPPGSTLTGSVIIFRKPWYYAFANAHHYFLTAMSLSLPVLLWCKLATLLCVVEMVCCPNFSSL